MAANYQIVQGYFNRSGIFRKGFTKISEGLPSNRVHPEVKTDWASPMKPTFFGGLKNLNLEVTIQRKLGNSFHIQVHSPYLMASSPSILKVKANWTLFRFEGENSVNINWGSKISDPLLFDRFSTV